MLLSFSSCTTTENSSDGIQNNDTVYVKGYYKKNGTYVHSYTRTAPDGIKSNNKSYKKSYKKYNKK